MANLLSRIIDFGARDKMNLDVKDYERKRQGSNIGAAGNLTTKRFNQEIKNRSRKQRATSGNAEANRTTRENNRSSTNSNRSADIGNIAPEDVMDRNKVSREEVKKLYKKLYNEKLVDSELDYTDDYYEQRLIVRDFLKNRSE